MTTIDESLTAKGFTPAASVPQVFGRPRTIDGIVIHHWGALGQNHDGVVNFFVNGPGTTSAHFVASEGRINCLVNPADAAWHSGNAVGNATTIGIECRPEATDGDYATVAELVAYLRSIYGPLPLSPHRQWQSTACPGVWDLARIDQLAGGATIATQGTITTPAEGFLMALNDQDQQNIYEAITRIDAFVQSNPVTATASAVLFGNRVDGRNIVDTGRQSLANDAAILAALSGLKVGNTITAADIAAAIPADIAKQVADLLAARLAA